MLERKDSRAEGRPERIVLAICTAARPEGLRRLLEALRSLEAPEISAVVVVDNDTGREGLGICRDLASGYPWPLAASHEPTRGISAARNRAVQEALELDPDFIAVLDDDEWPSAAWLRELVRVQVATGADVVGGPVVPVPAVAIAHWELFAQHYGLMRELPDMAPCLLYGAGNFMARRECFEALDGPFDRAFDRIGGEDLLFFRRLDRLGMRMRWAAQAVVYEETPADRLTTEWLLARQGRRGLVNVRVQRQLDPSLSAEGMRLARSFAALLRGAVRRLGATWRTEPAGLIARMDWAYALGRVQGHRRGDQAASFSHGGVGAEPK